MNERKMKPLNLEKIASLFTRLSKREKMIFYLASLVVFVLVFDRFMVRPIVNTFHSLDQEVHDLQTNIKKSVRLLAQKDRMMSEAKQYAAYSVKPKSPAEEAVALLKHIEELANHSSVNLLYAKPGGSQQPPEQIKKYYVNLEFEGQMEPLLNFFYEIENSKMLLRIEKYMLVPTANGSSIVKCTATVSRAVVS